MPGRFPEVLTDKIFGVEATRLYEDASRMVQAIVKEKWFSAHGVIGFWPARSNNRDTLTLQTERGECRLETLRQQMKKAVGQPSYSLADFVSPAGEDFMGAFAVTVHGAREHIARFAREHHEYNKIMVQILADVLSRPLQNACMSRCGKSGGAMPGRKPSRTNN